MNIVNKYMAIVGIVFVVLAGLAIIVFPVDAATNPDGVYKSTLYAVASTGIISTISHSAEVGDDLGNGFLTGNGNKTKANYNYNGASSVTVINSGGLAGIDQKAVIDNTNTNRYTMTKHVEGNDNGIVTGDAVGMTQMKPQISPVECTAGSPTDRTLTAVEMEGQTASEQSLEQQYTLIGAGGVYDSAQSVQDGNVSVSARVSDVNGRFTGDMNGYVMAALDANSTTADYSMTVKEHFSVGGNATSKLVGESNMKWTDSSNPFKMTKPSTTPVSNETVVNETNTSEIMTFNESV